MKEIVLPDHCPVYADYYYILDGVVKKPGITGRVSDIKAITGAREVRCCDMVGRGLMPLIRRN